MFCIHCKQICVSFEELDELIITGRLGALRLPDREFERPFNELKPSKKRGCELCRFILHCFESDPQFVTLKASSKESGSVALWLSFSRVLDNYRFMRLNLVNVEDQQENECAINVQIEGFTKNEPNSPWSSHISADPLSETSVEIANRWLKDCRSSHDSCNQTSFTRLPSRIIQIKSPQNEDQARLVDSSTIPDLIGNYVTLSHCWGTVARTTLGKGNLAVMQSGFLRSFLSQQFQDAMKAAEMLEMKYIWIDCLCIVQDSEEDLNHELARMADIYANSAITIAGLAASDSATSFLETRDAGRHFVQLEGQVSNIYLRKSLQPHYGTEETSLLEIRGWIFQEMKLTRRALLYGVDQMYWRCRELHDDEGHYDTDDSIYNLYQEKQQYLEVRTEGGEDPTHPSALMCRTGWYRLVDEYSAKSFTFPSDKIPAISAVAQQIGAWTGDLYLAGIWRRDLVNGLLWQRVSQGLSSSAISSKKMNEDRFSLIHLENTSTPSWSWAAYHGEVSTARLSRFIGVDWSELVEIKEASVDLIDPDYETGPVRSGKIVLHGACREFFLNGESFDPRCTVEQLEWTVKVPMCEGTMLEINFDMASERTIKAPVLCLVAEKQVRKAYRTENGDFVSQWHCLILRHAGTGTGCYRRVGVGQIEPGELSQRSHRPEDGIKRSEDERRSARDEWKFELETWISEFNTWGSETIVIV